MINDVQDAVAEGLDDSREQAQSFLNGAQKAVSNVTHDVKQIARTQAERQKEHLADELTNIGRALQSASRALAGVSSESKSVVGQRIIDKVNDVADSLRDRDIEHIVHDTEAYARKRPAAFLIASVAVGFVIARIVKSGSSGQTSRAGS